MYDKGRYFTVTGWHLQETPSGIQERQEEIEAIHAKIFRSEQKKSLSGNSVNDENPGPISNSYLLKKAMEAVNGDKFRQLWDGDFSGYASQSEADLALCGLLAFWTRKNPARMDALFRQSGLMRQKWDKKHFSDGQTYGSHTIAAAIENTIDVYDPQRRNEKDEPSSSDKPKIDVSYDSLDLPSSLEISRLEITVNWIVKDLIPQESITLLHSIGGVGKSYLMYGIAQSVADGTPFFDLAVIKMPVYYVDFENPLPEIVDRMKKLGGSLDLKTWHLSHDPGPIRFDADEWEVYKTFPPGLFIIDSLRSSHLLDENSSKDASFIMARHKEIRARGNTIVLIHHENKIGGYRGSTAWFDLSDHILKFGRVEKIGDDKDAEGDNFDLPIRLGLGGKSRFSSAMNFKPLFFKFEDHRLCLASDPDEGALSEMAAFLRPAYPPNQSEFRNLVKENMGLGRPAFDRLLKKGERLGFWYSKRSRTANRLEYFRADDQRF